MDKKIPIHELITLFENEVQRAGYSRQTMKLVDRLRRWLCEYADKCDVSQYTPDFGQKFLAARYPESIDSLFVNMSNSMREMRRTIMLLDNFWCSGVITKRAFKPNEGLSEASIGLIERYMQEGFGGNLSESTIWQHVHFAREFLRQLKQDGILVADISEKAITDFMLSKPKYSRQTLAGMGGSLKRFLKYLSETKETASDLSSLVPHMRTSRLARIPSVWKQEDVEKLLAAVDRGSPVGKRDYAILLIAAKMGLRTGDILSLKKENINWTQCRVELTQGKTGQPITLPLQNEVGWAIIDYMKNGRPSYDSSLIFISHSNNSMGEALKPTHGYILMEKYIRQAGIRLTNQQRRGLHSLRHTLATRLMEAKTPPSVIAEICGWVSPDTIEQYLKTDTETLRQCALNPKEVFADVVCG